MQRVSGTLLALSLALLGACASSRVETTWTDPSAVGKPLDLHKVAAVALFQDGAMRRVAEDDLAKAIREGAQGASGAVEAVPSYTLLSDDDVKSADVSRAKLRAAGFDGAAIVSVVDSQQRVDYVPGSASRVGYGYGWVMYDPGYMRTDTIVRVQTNIYDVEDGKLLWSGTTKNYNPRDVSDLIGDTVRDVGRELRKDGLIR